MSFGLPLQIHVPHLGSCHFSIGLGKLRKSLKSYPEIGNANFKCALWTFKQQLALNYEHVVEFLLFSYKHVCTVPCGICVGQYKHRNYRLASRSRSGFFFCKLFSLVSEQTFMVLFKILSARSNCTSLNKYMSTEKVQCLNKKVQGHIWTQSL